MITEDKIITVQVIKCVWWSKYGGQSFLVDHHKKKKILSTIQTLSPGQTESQVASTCDSVWTGIVCICVALRWLAPTLVEFTLKSAQVFYRLAAQAKSRQVVWYLIHCLNNLLASEIQTCLREIALRWVIVSVAFSCDFNDPRKK